MTEQVSTVRSYRSGGWFGIFGEHASVLLPPSEKARVAALWELVDAGSDFNELLDALIASGLRGLPGFVLVSSGDEPTRVVLRGAARGHFTVADGEDVEVDGGAAATWVEKILHGVTTVRLDLEAGGGSDDYVIEAGLVRVSRVDEPPYDQSAGGVDTEPFAEVQEVPADRVDEVVETDEAVQTVPSDDGSSAAFSAAAGGLAAPVVVPLGEITDAESARESSQELPQAAEHAHQEAGDEATEEPGGAPFAAYAEEPAAEEPVAEEPVAEEPAGPADEPTERFDPMQHEAGDYEPAPVEPAAVEPVVAHAEGQATEEPAAEDPAAEELGEEIGEDEPHWPFSDPEDTGEQPAAEAAAPEAPAPPWGPAQGDVYSPSPAPSNPFTPDAAAPLAPPAPPVPPFDDHDGNTVAGGWDPSQFARQQPGIPGQPQAPSVTAQPVARLVFSSGETIDVDRAVLIGRAPEARRFTATDQPRLVTVPSPHQEISSTHVEVRPGSGADHGSAVVTDLGSTNGTVLTQPGLAAEDLQPGMAVQLLPGAVIDLGDGVTIRVTNL